MIELKKYIGRKVYIELEAKLDDKDPEEEDKVQGGSIYKTIDEIMESASEGDEFIEIEISKQFKALNQCMQVCEIRNGKVVRKSKV
jgi:hypothetical protein